MWSTEHRDFYVFIPAAQPEQKCRYVIDIPLFWIGPKEGQADVIYCSLSIYFLRDRDKLIQMSTITLFVFFFLIDIWHFILLYCSRKTWLVILFVVSCFVASPNLCRSHSYMCEPVSPIPVSFREQTGISEFRFHFYRLSWGSGQCERSNFFPFAQKERIVLQRGEWTEMPMERGGKVERASCAAFWGTGMDSMDVGCMQRRWENNAVTVGTPFSLVYLQHTPTCSVLAACGSQRLCFWSHGGKGQHYKSRFN